MTWATGKRGEGGRKGGEERGREGGGREGGKKGDGGRKENKQYCALVIQERRRSEISQVERNEKPRISKTCFCCPALVKSEGNYLMTPLQVRSKRGSPIHLQTNGFRDGGGIYK